MSSPSRIFQMMQTLIDEDHSTTLSIINESAIKPESFDKFNHVKPLGLAAGFNRDGKLIALAIADNESCLIIELPAPARNSNQRGSQSKSSRSPNNPATTSPAHNNDGLKTLEAKVLLRSCGNLYAFDAAPLSMALYLEFQLQITNIIDIQSAASAVPLASRIPLDVIKVILGDSVPIKEQNITRVFQNNIYEKHKDRDHGIPALELSQRAWISQFLVIQSNGAETFDKVPAIDTRKLTIEQISMVSKIGNDALRLDQAKPMTTTHEFVMDGVDLEQGVKVKAMAYKTKFRPHQVVKMNIQSASGSTYSTHGQLGVVSGKSGYLNSERTVQGKNVLTVKSIGKDAGTMAEKQRAATILRILQGSTDLLDRSPWITAIWFPEEGKPMTWPKHFSEASYNHKPPSPPSPQSPTNPSPPTSVQIELNSSQQVAVNTMLSCDDNHRITIVQGPPGTGKTSVIAAFVQLSTLLGSHGIWLVAQSNVAVKNIAEKLLKIGFTNWVLLISKDFHFEWHEHIYSGVTQNIIRSDEFVKCSDSRWKHARVMLCTLSMLSNPHLGKFTHSNPVKTLVVDEASQIEIGNYISVFSKYPTLRKTCFIGDDQQLPPYGQEELEDLQSIFEVAHLRPNALFLDTQYRMPPQIGQIISEAVYNFKLGSNPLHPITSKTVACRFIDAQGTEQKSGDSFKNENELAIVISLAQKLQEQGKAYQIITPYEGQRSSIEQRMKETEGLVWENKCFNVDSFQGNEEDYIIISLVRSRELGFLVNLRRTNVMLTRCKKGQFIISSKTFLTNKGSTTLVGTLLEKMGPESWLDMKAVEGGNF